MNDEPKYIHVYDSITGLETQREMTDEELAAHKALQTETSSIPSSGASSE